MNDTDNIPDLAGTILKAVKNTLLDVHTALPAIIEEFDPNTQLAKVSPAIKRIFKSIEADGKELFEAVELPSCLNVPVQCLRWGNFEINAPVTKGDECLLIFSERSIDNWHKSGKISEPSAFRQHSLSDAFAILGFHSTPRKISGYSTTDLVIRNVETNESIRIKGSGGINVSVAEGNDIHLIGDVKISGDLTQTGDIDIVGNISASGDVEGADFVINAGIPISFKSHKHGGVTSGGGFTLVPSP